MCNGTLCSPQWLWDAHRDILMEITWQNGKDWEPLINWLVQDISSWVCTDKNVYIVLMPSGSFCILKKWIMEEVPLGTGELSSFSLLPSFALLLGVKPWHHLAACSMFREPEKILYYSCKLAMHPSISHPFITNNHWTEWIEVYSLAERQRA